MQMAMAQQQAASGEAPMTVAQQREKEVMGLTKDELAGQVGGELQQQQGEQQAAMQKLMSGIASAPGAQSAATPQAMAAGGIVAFNGEGPSQEVRKARRGYIIDPETGEERPMTIRERYAAQVPPAPEASQPQAPVDNTETTTGMMLRSVGDQFRDPDARKKQQEYLKYEERKRGITQAISAVTPGMLEQLLPETRGIMAQHKEYLRGQLNQRPAASAPAAAPAGAYREESREDRRVGPIAAGGNTPPPSATRRPAGPAAPTMPPAPAAPAGLSPEQNEMQTALSQGILGAQRTNPAAEQGAEYMRASNILGMSPEEKALIADNRAKTAEMTAARFNPEEQRGERLTQFLLGMGGQSLGSGALGAGGTSAVNYRRSMEDAERGEKLGLMKLREGDFEKERGIRGKAYEGGLKALELSSRSRDQGVASGASLVATLQRSADDAKKLVFEGDQKALDRAVEREKIKAQNATTEAKRTGDQQQAVSALLMTASARVMETTGKISTSYAKIIKDVVPGKDSAKQIRDLETRRDAEIQAATAEMARDTDALRTRLLEMASGSGKSTGAPSGGGTNAGAPRILRSYPTGGQ
jgi:hypothetical protein